MSSPAVIDLVNFDTGFVCPCQRLRIEDLTNILIDRGYIIPPRSHRRRAVFRERLELLVMSALYLLGSGAAFRSCKPLCGISTLEV